MEISDVVYEATGGTAIGLSFGYAMCELKFMKVDTPVEKIEHWVLGTITSIIGIIVGFTKKYEGLSVFLTTMGLGILLTDVRDLGKQLDNLRDQEPLDTGIASKTDGDIDSNNLIKVDWEN